MSYPKGITVQMAELADLIAEQMTTLDAFPVRAVTRGVKQAIRHYLGDNNITSRVLDGCADKTERLAARDAVWNVLFQHGKLKYPLPRRIAERLVTPNERTAGKIAFKDCQGKRRRYSLKTATT